MSGSGGGPRQWELALFDVCLRAWPSDLDASDAEGMRATFVDRRRATRLSGVLALADTLGECRDVLLAGVGARLAVRRPVRRPTSAFTVRRMRRFDGSGSIAGTLRLLSRRPVWSLLVVATLCAGIGATTAIFSVVDSVVVRSLPYDLPESLVRIGGVREGRPGLSSVSGPNFRDLEETATRLSAVAASSPGSIALGTADGPADQVRGGWVSGAFFELLGREALVGRTISREDDRRASSVVVLSYGLWSSRFGREDVIGRVLELDGRATTVIGVMGPDFHPPEGAHLGGTLLWLPLSVTPLPVGERSLSFLDVIGRVGPGATRLAVDAELASIGSALRDTHGLPPRQFATFASRALTDETVGDADSTLGLLMGAVGLLLLIACANVANLMLVRVQDRSAELAIRVSLGATRRRIAGDLISESLVLALAGGGFGIGLAYFVVDAIRRTAPFDLPRLQEVTVDERVLLFAVVLSVAVAMLVSLIPSLRAVRADPRGRSAERGSSSSRSRNRTRDVLVVAQAAIGIVLLAGAGLLVNSLVRLHAVDAGLRTTDLHILAVRLDRATPAGPGASPARHDALLDAVRAVPGVRRASLTSGAPFTAGGFITYIQPEGVEVPEEDLVAARIGMHQVSAGHFENIGARVLEGREFSDLDRQGSTPVVMVSRSLARSFWPDGNAVGARLVVGGDGTFTPRTVIGVVDPPLYAGPASADDEHVYLPYAQFPPADADLMLRIDRVDASVTAALRTAIHEADANASIRTFTSADAALAAFFVQPAFFAMLLTAFASFSLLLAAGGLYTTLAFSVARRHREFGIRLALGANAPELVRTVVGRGIVLTATGTAIGMLVALAGRQVLDGFVFGISTADLPTHTIASVLFLAVGTLASWIPARRAGRTTPLSILHPDP